MKHRNEHNEHNENTVIRWVYCINKKANESTISQIGLSYHFRFDCLSAKLALSNDRTQSDWMTPLPIWLADVVIVKLSTLIA